MGKKDLDTKEKHEAGFNERSEDVFHLFLPRRPAIREGRFFTFLLSLKAYSNTRIVSEKFIIVNFRLL